MTGICSLIVLNSQAVCAIACDNKHFLQRHYQDESSFSLNSAAGTFRKVREMNCGGGFKRRLENGLGAGR
jgi:hypothetical protein